MFGESDKAAITTKKYRKCGPQLRIKKNALNQSPEYWFTLEPKWATGINIRT